MHSIHHEDGMAYDVIGDIHGYHDELAALLHKLGYQETGKGFTPPANRKAFFIGDFIDRGPKNIEVVKTVRTMVEAGYAHAILGNHDYNAVQWTRKNPQTPGDFIRPHSEKNFGQHKVFLDEVGKDKETYQSIIDWFKTLPVVLKIGNYNFSHACWSPGSIETLIEKGHMNPTGELTDSGWNLGADKKSHDYKLLDVLLNGPEEKLANGLSFTDIQGHVRTESRVAWWNGAPKTYAEAYASLPADFIHAAVPYSAPEGPSMSQKVRDELRAMPKTERIFIGHIWEFGLPKPLTDRVVCVDYRVAKPGGRLASFRIDAKEMDLSQHHYTWVDRLDSHMTSAKPAPVTA